MKNRNLLVSPAILSFQQLKNLDEFDNTLNDIKNQLVDHVTKKCNECEYEGEICGFLEKSIFKD